MEPTRRRSRVVVVALAPAREPTTTKTSVANNPEGITGELEILPPTNCPRTTVRDEAALLEYETQPP